MATGDWPALSLRLGESAANGWRYRLSPVEIELLLRTFQDRRWPLPGSVARRARSALRRDRRIELSNAELRAIHQIATMPRQPRAEA